MYALSRLTKAFIECLYERVKYHCHDAAAADFITTAVRLLLQPKMDFHSCTLGKTLLFSVCVFMPPSCYIFGLSARPSISPW